MIQIIINVAKRDQRAGKIPPLMMMIMDHCCINQYIIKNVYKHGTITLLHELRDQVTILGGSMSGSLFSYLNQSKRTIIAFHLIEAKQFYLSFLTLFCSSWSHGDIVHYYGRSKPKQPYEISSGVIPLEASTLCIYISMYRSALDSLISGEKNGTVK